MGQMTLLPGITKCQVLCVPFDGLVCALLESGQPFGTAMVSPFGKSTLSLLFALSFSFPHNLNYLWFLIQSSTFLFLLIISAERLHISPARAHTHLWTAETDLSATDTCPSIAKNLFWDSSSGMRGTPGILPFHYSLPLGQQQKCDCPVEASCGDQLLPNLIPPWVFCAPLNSCKP